MDNNQCMGYIIKAMEELGKSPAEIRDLLQEMNYWFDMMTESEAQSQYDKKIGKYWNYRD